MKSITGFLQKLLSYTKRHFDFLMIDIVTFFFAYFISVQVRRAMNLAIYHGELFLTFGIVALVIYVIVEYLKPNLNGIMSRSIAREAEAVLVQMMISWSFFTVVLFLYEEAHEFSRAIYVTAFVFCFFAILIARTIWKTLVRYSRLHERISPGLLIVCEAQKADEVLKRMLKGSFENYYQISGVLMNEKGTPNYHDWYPHEVGLDKLGAFLSNRHIQDAYVELDDAEEEGRVIKELLDAGLIVNRSLGDSKLDYVSQRIKVLGGKPVIVIEDTRISLASKVDRWIEMYRQWRGTRDEE